MAMLSLDKKVRNPDPPKVDPVFDPEAHYGEVGGVDGVTYVQGKNLFNRARQFVREGEKSMWLAPLTPEQEQMRRRQLQANKKYFAVAKPPSPAAVPQRILDAERENAQARSAEAQVA